MSSYTITDFWPVDERVRNDLLSYQSIEQFHFEMKQLWTSFCRLAILPEHALQEIEQEMWSHFKTPSSTTGITLDPSIYTPSLMDDLYNSIPYERQEEFLFTLRGLLIAKRP